MIYFAGLIFVITILIGNLNGFAIKRVLKDNGFDVKYFSGHFSDTKNILKLAKVTADTRTRKRYYRMGFLDITFGLAFLSSAIFLFSSLPSLNDSACNAYKEFRSQEYKVVIVDKYIDKKEHSYPTLICKDLKANRIVNHNLVHDVSGFFKFVSIGDTLIKQKNEIGINIKNAKTDTIYVLDYGCNEKNNR
jgi:hypothetical protein